LTPYFNSVINTTGDLCAYVNGTDRNPAIKWMINMIGDSLPKGFIHACPYYREFIAYNATLKLAPEMTVFLLGSYRLSGRIFEKMDENIFTACIDFDMFLDRSTKTGRFM